MQSNQKNQDQVSKGAANSREETTAPVSPSVSTETTPVYHEQDNREIAVMILELTCDLAESGQLEAFDARDRPRILRELPPHASGCMLRVMDICRKRIAEVGVEATRASIRRLADAA